MRLMRSALLWMAGNERMQQTIPKLPFAKRAVRRFMPGERLDDALAAADRLRDERIGVLLTRLGENISSLHEAGEVAAHYREVLKQDATSEHPQGPVEISIKPTQLGLDQDPEACFAHCDDIARRCAEAGTWFWLDMEGAAYTDGTVDLAERLMKQHDNVGVALQAYLKRTAADVQRLLPYRPAIRLVKGAYDEPASIAYRSGTEVDANYVALSVIIAGPAGRGEARLCLGTHDIDLIEQISTVTSPSGVPNSALEVHMLYGIREQELRRLRDAGYPTASLISYGSAWYRWYVRRLAERPANVIFALRQLIP
ncbi:MAG: proline dehydrogenase family protein [Chloroflexota bacterium]